MARRLIFVFMFFFSLGDVSMPLIVFVYGDLRFTICNKSEVPNTLNFTIIGSSILWFAFIFLQ